MPKPDPRPRGRPQQRLATRIAFLVLGSCFTTGLVVSWVSIHSTYGALRRAIDREYPAALRRVTERQAELFARGTALLDLLASAEELGELARRGRGAGAAERARAEGRLATALAESDVFEGLALLSAEGGVLVRVGGVTLSASLPGPAAPGLAALGGGDAAPPVARISALAEPHAGTGFLLGAFSQARIEALLASEAPPEGARLLLVDGDGHPVSTPARARAAAPLPLEWILSGPAPEVREYTSPEGVRTIASALPLDGLAWFVAVEAPFEVAFAPVRAVAEKVLALNICAVLILSGLAYRRAALLVRPIGVLCDRALRIAGGELDLELPEPSTTDEVGLLTRTFNDVMRKLQKDKVQLEAAYKKLQHQNTALQQANEVLNQLSITDGLTKLHNHRFFQDHLTREIKRVSRSGEPLSMLLIDIDDFKGLNDRLGHAAGDEVLLGIARIMNSTVRDSDLLARYGGEEFVVLAPNTDRLGAYQLAEKVRTAIAESSFILGDSLRPTRVTISIGVAQYAGNRKLFFQAADRALYASKTQGKNCVVPDEEL